jgi:hypothetical protein
MSEKIDILRPESEDINEAVLRGVASGGGEAATLGALGQIGNILLTKDKMSRDEREMVKSMIKKVERVNPDLLIKELLPIETDNPFLKLYDKIRRRSTGYYDARNFKPTPERYWKHKDKVLGKIRDTVDAAYRPKIVAPSDAATLMHELGHAEHLAGSTPIQQHILRRVVPAAGAALGGYLASQGNEDIAPIVAAAGTAPLLWQELQASGRAVKHMYKERGLAEAAKGAAKLAPAFLTYAAIPMGIYYGVKNALRNLDERTAERAVKYKELFEKKSHLLDGFMDGLTKRLSR